MGIILASSFDMQAALPLDSRTVVADITARDAILSGRRYEGMIVYVTSQSTNYQLVGGITDSDWSELSGSGGTTVDDTLIGKSLLVNNSTNDILAIGEYIEECPGLIINYYMYRRTDTGVRRMSGSIRFEGLPDEPLSPDKWSLLETLRSEYGGASGATFGLTEVDTNKSVLSVLLDDMTGASHICKFHYEVFKLSNVTGRYVILDNNSITPINTIGEYLVDAGCVLIEYFIYRRTDDAFKTISGKIYIEGDEDAVTNPDKWQLYEAERNENLGASGVAFSLDDIDTEKSILVVTLDDMTGANHECYFYYRKTVMSN